MDPIQAVLIIALVLILAFVILARRSERGWRGVIEVLGLKAKGEAIGPDNVVRAEKKSKIRDVQQTRTGAIAGRNVVEASDESEISGVKQQNK